MFQFIVINVSTVNSYLFSYFCAHGLGYTVKRSRLYRHKNGDIIT